MLHDAYCQQLTTVLALNLKGSKYCFASSVVTNVAAPAPAPGKHFYAAPAATLLFSKEKILNGT
jgi:hypothetical protein